MIKIIVIHFVMKENVKGLTSKKYTSRIALLKTLKFDIEYSHHDIRNYINSNIWNSI